MNARAMPDRHPLHDALCAYLIDQDVRLEVLNTLLPPHRKPVAFRCYKTYDSRTEERWEKVWSEYAPYLPPLWTFRGTEDRCLDATSVWGVLEHPVIAKSQRVVGNLDVYLGGDIVTAQVGTCRRNDADGTTVEVRNVTFRHSDAIAVAIEVKARVGSVGEVIRQVKRYQAEWWNSSGEPRPRVWAVCTPNLPPAVSSVLAQNDIRVVGVDGHAFRNWCRGAQWALPADALALLGPAPSHQLPLSSEETSV